jgi:hypothetical protein
LGGILKGSQHHFDNWETKNKRNHHPPDMAPKGNSFKTSHLIDESLIKHADKQAFVSF